MQSYLKTRPVFIQLLLFIGMAMGLYLALYFIGLLFIERVTGINPLTPNPFSEADINNPKAVLFLRIQIIIQFIGFLVAPSLLFAYFSDPEPLKYLGIKTRQKLMYWVLGTAALLVALPLAEYTGHINKQINFGSLQEWLESMENAATLQVKILLTNQNVGQLLLNIIFIALFAGIGEELFFRGIIQRLLIRGFKNPWVGIVVTAILFAGIHFQFFGFIPRLLLGIILGTIYWYSGSLIAAMISHFAYDAFLVVMSYFQPEIVSDSQATVFNGSAQIIPAVISTVLVALIIWVMKKNSTTNYFEVYRGDKVSTHQDLSF
jgi:uncharacterized protein